MAQYINKAALVEELNWLIAELVEEGEGTMFEQGRISALEDIKCFIDYTLKVKEGNILTKAKGFLVRDKDDFTAIYSTKPERGKTEWVDGNHPRNANESSCLFTVDSRLLPNVEFGDEPVEVEITITKKGE